MPAKLESRFPMIIEELRPRVDAAIRVGAELISERAKEKAPDRPPMGQGLVEAIHVEDDSAGYYVVGGDKDHWYGHFLEFGTVKAAAHPFLVPAAEESKAEVAAGVTAVLRGL